VLRVLAGRHAALWPDADERGRRHMARIAARLAALGITVRLYDPAPDATDGRDAADDQRDAASLWAALAAAPAWSSTQGTREAVEQPAGILLADVAPERVDWLWHGRLARGKLSVLEGRPDEGKTTLALDLGARVSTGAQMPGETAQREPAGVVVVTAEDGLADTIRPRLEAAGADLTRCLAARPDESPSLDADGLAWLRRACVRVEAALVILDPLVALMPGAVDAHRDQDVRRMLRPLRALAEELNVAVLAIRHLRKAAAPSPKDAGGGSVGIGAAARIVMLAAPDPDDGERRVLARVKCNLAAPWPSLSYRLVPTAGTVAVEWGGEVTHTAETLLAAANTPEDPEERTRVDEAAEAIRAMLAGGPVLVTEARQRLRPAGISDKTADRARARLGVRARPDGYQGAWRWHARVSPSPRIHGDTGETAETGSGDGADAAETPVNSRSRQSRQSRHLHAAGDDGDGLAVALDTFDGATVVSCGVCGGTAWRPVGDGEVCVRCHPREAR